MKFRFCHAFIANTAIAITCTIAFIGSTIMTGCDSLPKLGGPGQTDENLIADIDVLDETGEGNRLIRVQARRKGTATHTAVRHMRIREFDEAIDVLAEHLEQAPDDDVAHFAIAVAYEWIGDADSDVSQYEKAIHHYKRAIFINTRSEYNDGWDRTEQKLYR